MKTKVIDNTLDVTLRVVIVEDNQDKAFALKSIFEEYTSVFTDKKDIHGNLLSVRYFCLINGVENMEYQEFNGTKAYAQSMGYIQNNMKDVDIIMCDHNLDNNKDDGNVFLSEVASMEKKKKAQIFKILHSVLGDFQHYQRAPFVDAIYNANEIDKGNNLVLKGYEERVLKYILFGNPDMYTLFYNSIFNNEFGLKQVIEREYKGVPMEKILYVYSGYGKQNYQFAYIESDYTIHEVRHFMPMSDFDNEWFFKVTDSLYINKLWFAQKDIESNKVKCISRGESLGTLDLDEAFAL